MKKLIVFAAIIAVACLMVTSSGSAYDLVWQEGTGDGAPTEGYIVDVSTDGAVTFPFHYTVSEPVLALDDKTSHGQEYVFKISAYNAAGRSAPTESLTWTRPPFVPPTDAPLPPINAPASSPETVRVE